MFKPKARFSRADVIAMLALFVALSGTAVATVGKNDVKSKHVKNNALKSKDLKDGKAVTGDDVVDNSLKGADIDEGSLNISQASSLPPSGPAGGDLTGSYPNPLIKPDAVGAAEVINQSLTGRDIENNTINADDAFGLRGDDDIENGSLTHLDVKDESLHGTDINERSLRLHIVDYSPEGSECDSSSEVGRLVLGVPNLFEAGPSRIYYCGRKTLTDEFTWWRLEATEGP